MAGVKDEKSFYKKYKTEADFLKAYPEAKTQLEKFALGGIDANRQTYPKTITYTPQEWHQKNILAGNVMLGKNNDLNTMFKNNIYPQYTLPNDTVPINYSPVVKQLQMPQGFVDNSKSTFNYAAGQQLPKQANGGKMNIKAMQQFAGGGFFQDAGEGIGNYFKAVADTTLGTFGASNVIKDEDYSGYGANEMSNLNKTLQPITSAILPMAANIALPGSGAIVSAGQKAIGTMNPKDNTGLDENGNPKNPDAAKYQQAGQTVAQLGGIGAQIYGASKAPSTSGGIPNGGPIKRAMGGMQYAMGGEIQYANGGTGEINAEVEDNENAIGPNGEFTQFSGPTHAEGGIETDMAPGTMIFSDKLKMPGSKKSFADLNKLYDTNKEDDVLSNEKSNNTLKLTAMLMRDAKLKQSLALFQEQEQFKQDKVAAYAKRMGVQIPSQDNEQMEPQGMPEQSEGEMSMAMHGGMMNYMAKGGMIKRADGSYSKRGLWDNIRANAGSGKAPTKEMLEQEAKINSYQVGGLNDRMNYTTRNLDNNSYNSYRKINTETGPRFYNASSPDLSTANKMIDFKIRNNQSDSIPMNQIPQNVITNFKNYQVGGNTDPGKLSDIQRQLKVVKQQISTLQPDSSFVSGPLAKLRGLEKDLTIRQNNHPEFKKAMGGRLPMYQDGRMTPMEENDNIYLDAPSRRTYNITEHPYLKNQYLLPYGKELSINENETGAPISLGNQTIQSKTLGTPIQTNNDSGSNFYNNQFYDENHVPPLNPVPPKGEGFDYKKAAGNLGQFALQNAGNIYDLYRSTQDNSKLNLSRMSPTFLDKTQDLQNNLRLYSEGKRQTAEASQGNASTYLSNMYANRASKLANDLNINTTYGNLNASIDNAAKLYNAGAIDKETMFKLQSEGMNRNLKGQALAGMSQNFMNQGLTNDKTSMDEKTLNLFTKNMKDPTFRKDLLEFMNKKESKVKE